MLSCSHLSIAVLFAHSAYAFKAFEPNCTSPRDHVSWVSPPAIRGTMDIIFSTFSVLLICTWAIQHLSVPPHKTHFWNRKTVKDGGYSARYSAFLDDARFNYTKLKWMATSLLAPEYILAKALSEFLAAHDSRRQFKELRSAGRLPKQPTQGPERLQSSRPCDPNEWTTTHAYFANMGGFILRFNVEAVEMSLEPHQPDELERSLFIRNPDDDPPYLPQDMLKAEARELEHCRQGKPCKNHPNKFDLNQNESSEGSNSDSHSNPALLRDENESHPLLQVVVDNNAQSFSIEALNGALPPTDQPYQPSENSAVLTPSTLMNQPEGPSYSTYIPLVNRNEYLTNSTPTTAVDEQKFPFSVDKLTGLDGSDHKLQQLHTERSVHSHEGYQPKKSTIHRVKERLIPHRKWQATWALSSMQVLYAIREGIIPLPETSAEELNDRSKGDALVKILACLHISWLVIQILARGVEGIAITQLEIMVLGFSACALVTYFLLFYKPQDVKVPTYIDIPNTLTRPQIIQLAARSPVATLMVQQFWLHGVAIRAMADNVFPWTPGIRFQIPHLMKTPIFLNPHLIGIGGGGAIFGGIHVAAWNFTFPTPVERLLWRISATYLVSIPLVGVFIYWFVQHFTRRSQTEETDNKADKVLRPIGRVAIPLYLLARMCLLVEVFRCLAFPPPSTFETVGWPSLIPHIS